MKQDSISKDLIDTGDLSEIASRLLDLHGGSVIEASAAFVSLVEGNDTLYRRITAPLLAAACYDVVSAVVRGRRQRVWETPQPTASTTKHRLRALHDASLLDFALPGGLLLRDSDQGEVLTAAMFYDKQSTDMRIKGAWLGAIAKAMPNPKVKVGQVLDDAALRKLQAQAQTKQTTAIKTVKPIDPSPSSAAAKVPSKSTAVTRRPPTQTGVRP